MTNEEVLKLIEDGRIAPIQIKANDEETSKYNLENLEGINRIIKALKQQSTLDKIREEVKLLSNANPSYWHSGDMVEREDVFDIIDKYRERDDEE